VGNLLWGWYALGKKWVKLQADENGIVKVDLSAVKLGDLGDVNVPAPTDGHFLYWNDDEGEWQDKEVAAAIGGLYGINVETLSDAKTLTANVDKIYQYLDTNGATRNITLDTASATAGDRFVLRNTSTFTSIFPLQIKQAAIVLDTAYAGDIKEFIFDGTNWVSRGVGTGENNSRARNTGIGYGAKAYNAGVSIGNLSEGQSDGVAVGYEARGYTNSVAIGRYAFGYTEGVGIGYHADGASKGIAIGNYPNTNSKVFSIALGYKSETERAGETSININGDDSDQENNVVQGRFEKATTNATPIEMFCAGYTNERFTIRASSVLAFQMIITARDNVAGHVAMWTVADGCIKRDASNNTTLLSATVVEVQNESTDWTVTVTADDTHEALKITVTGDETNPTQFAAVMNGVETHF